MKYQYVSINSIFSKLIRDTSSEFNEDDVLEWAGEIIDPTFRTLNGI